MAIYRAYFKDPDFFFGEIVGTKLTELNITKCVGKDDKGHKVWECTPEYNFAKLLGLGESICIEFNTETGTAVLLPREKVLIAQR